MLAAYRTGDFLNQAEKEKLAMVIPYPDGEPAMRQKLRKPEHAGTRKSRAPLCSEVHNEWPEALPHKFVPSGISGNA
jgi:hypothetical protein